MDSKKVIVEAGMLIRKPAAIVFEAFINPEITTKFWFTKSSGKLEEGKSVTWMWEMYGASAQVFTKKIIPNQLISIQWGDPATTVDFEFTALTDNTTYLLIKNHGFDLQGENLIQAVKDNTGGFTTLVDSAKAYLEHNLQLNLVGDKYPSKKS